VRRDTIAFIWIGGLVLAVALYAVGPDRFFDLFVNLWDNLDLLFRNLALMLGAQVFGVVRALAIAIYFVFAALALLSVQRGRRGVWALVVVTVFFLVLVGSPFGAFTAPVGRWILALALVLFAAAMMTQRLLGPPRRRDLPPPPYPPGFRQ
jgi:hypothetical protein